MDKKQKVMASTLENHIYNVLYNNSDKFKDMGFDQQGELCIEVAEEFIGRLDEVLVVTTAKYVEEKWEELEDKLEKMPKPNWKVVEIMKLPDVVVHEYDNPIKVIGLVRVALENANYRQLADEFTQRAMYEDYEKVMEIAQEYAHVVVI